MKHHFSSLATVLIFAALLFGTSAFQGQSNNQAQSARCCSPRVQDLVSRDGKVQLLKKKPSAPIYKVPVDRWFILTDLHLEYLGDRTHRVDPNLVQRQDGKDLVRVSYRFLKRNEWESSTTTAHLATAPLGNPTTGLAFPPKSLVMLSTKDLRFKDAAHAYHMRGYLTNQ